MKDNKPTEAESMSVSQTERERTEPGSKEVSGQGPESAQKGHKEVIRESWYRCEQFGLDHASQPDFGSLSKGDLSELREEHKGLLDTTENEVLPYYENILSNSACMIVLADRQGHVLNTWGRSRFGSASQHGLVDGNQWSELGVGTNAIGTALTTGHAIQVGRDEHFLRANRFMVGSASPIYDSSNDLVGVLDISSDAYLPQDHTLGMVKLMTLSVENRLIFSAFQKEHFLLMFNTNLGSLDSHWSGLLGVDENGVIVSANRRAEIVLAHNLALLHINQVFNCEMRDIKQQPPSLPMQLEAMGRYQMYVKVIPPLAPIMRVPDFRSHPDYVAPNHVNHNDRQRQFKVLPVEATEVSTSEFQDPAVTESPKSKPDIPDNVIPLTDLEHGDERVERLVRQAHKIMEKDIPILIHGETGVGKEILVRSLHYHSSRAREMLVAVNCAAIPSELVESELFGYAKGAFTGAQAQGSIGLIRRAHRGTLFLDEIGEMPLTVQSRLLRVLQERVVTPLGSSDAYPVDIKLISATNRTLKEEVTRGEFRQDLYYRISGLNVELPPLRERADRRKLILYVHERLRREEPGPPLSKSMLDLLDQHAWPGNVRQLVFVLKVGMAMADGEELEDWHLPDDFHEELGDTRAGAAKGPDSEPLEQLIPRLFDQYKGNVSQTAKAAGVSRNTVYKYAPRSDT